MNKPISKTVTYQFEDDHEWMENLTDEIIQMTGDFPIVRITVTGEKYDN